jgi:lipoprotein NlpD
MKPAVACLFATMLLASCALVTPPADRSRGPGWYTVKVSDTLYSIAWRYGLDYHELASWNQIDAGAPIHPGQRLRLVQPQNTAAPASSTRATTTAPATAAEPKTAASSGQASVVASETSAFADPETWIWPTAGKPLNTFAASRLDSRGIDIAGRTGQDVVAVADGMVVYSGNGLAGYGNLIIIKHSDTYLSAYAYCQRRLVEEGVSVKAGKQVATMGQKDNVAKLHFEIRRNGKPVDPMKYLPQQ